MKATSITQMVFGVIRTPRICVCRGRNRLVYVAPAPDLERHCERRIHIPEAILPFITSSYSLHLQLALTAKARELVQGPP